MSNLRLLIINRQFSEGFCHDKYQRHLALPGNVRHLALPNNLRYLQWSCCPFIGLASSHKQRREIVHLELRNSLFEYIWEGVMVILFFFLIVFLFFLLFLFFFFFLIVATNTNTLLLSFIKLFY